MAVLPGHPVWGSQAEAALALVSKARGDTKAAAVSGQDALKQLEAAMSEDSHLRIRLAAAEAIISGGSEQEIASVREHFRIGVTLMLPRIVDHDIRSKWLRGPIGKELIKIAGSMEIRDGEKPDSVGPKLSPPEVELLRLLIDGRTNREIAEQLHSTEQAVSVRFADLFAKIGASSRAEATATALFGKLV